MYSKFSLFFGSLSPEQSCLWSGDNYLFVLTGTTTVCSSNESSCISDMKQNFYLDILKLNDRYVSRCAIIIDAITMEKKNG